MKNSLNLVFAVFMLVVLGCSCPNLKDLDKKTTEDKPTTTNTPTTASNTGTSPSKDDEGKSSLTLAKYNQIKDKMSYKEVVAILGTEGTETSSSKIGAYKIASYKWDGGDFQMIYCTFSNDKLSSKTQANLK